MDALEVRALFAELARHLDRDLSNLWATDGLSSTEFRALIEQAFPELVLPYSAAASEIAAEWYDTTPTTSTGYRVKQGDLPSVDRLASSAQWALNVGNAASGLTLLQGAATRAVLDGARDTIMTNVRGEKGARWSRYASASTKCSFCRMLATRDNYLSEATAGFDAHDNCKCIPAMIRPGQQHQQPAYLDRWQEQYQQARRDAGSGDPKAILAAWDRLITT
ncbi:hypothetical protein GS496_17245 [Rhodococcus hoagii]|nr:hypothetical protein [Prescottella equi]